MILRIQQFDAADAERLAGWGDAEAVGAIKAPLPPGINAFELSVLKTDEQQQSVAPEQRRQHLRNVAGSVAEALRGEGDALVVRLDGPVAPGELTAAFRYLTDARGYGRFAVSPVHKLVPGNAPAMGGVRIEVTGAAAVAESLFGDTTLGIDRSVRMRVFAVPAVLVNPLLDAAELDDERWLELLAGATFILQNTHALDALQVLTRRSAKQVSEQLSSRLDGGAVQSESKSPR